MAVPAIHPAVVVGHHQGVPLIGAPYQCNSLLGATSGVGLERSARDRICANGQPRRAVTAAAATIHQKYAPTKPTSSRTATN